MSNSIDIEIEDIYLEVEYDYTPPEDSVPYYADGSGYPGAPAKVDIYKITAGGKEDITPLLADYIIDNIEDEIYKIYEN